MSKWWKLQNSEEEFTSVILSLSCILESLGILSKTTDPLDHIPGQLKSDFLGVGSGHLHFFLRFYLFMRDTG